MRRFISSHNSHNGLVRTLFAFAILFGATAVASAQERFALEVRGEPKLSSNAVLERGRLTVVDPQGQTFVYTRDRKLDSRDGDYLGFYSEKARQALRFPADGSGAMEVGDATGTRWRTSRQTVRPVGRRPANRPVERETRRIPLDPRPTDRDRLDPRGRSDQQADALRVQRPFDLAVMPSVGEGLAGAQTGAQMAAQIDRSGRLRFFDRRGDQWRPRDVQNVSGLVPGASIALSRDARGRDATAWTVDDRGRLLGIGSDGRARSPVRDFEFSPGADLAIASDARGQQAFAVDRSGRIVQLDLGNGRGAVIDDGRDRYAAGSPLSIANDGRDLFLIDRSGALVNYSNAGGRWAGPHMLDEGFLPGSAVNARVISGVGGDGQLYVAAVDGRGRLRLFRNTRSGWRAEHVQQARLTPGARVALAYGPRGLQVTAVDPRGVWREWIAGPGGVWSPREIAAGFTAGAPVYIDPAGSQAFAVDALGRLVTSDYTPGGWDSSLLLPDYSIAPRLVSRRIIDDPRGRSKRVLLENPSSEELRVQIYDRQNPVGPTEFTIPPRDTVEHTIQPSGGGVLEEIYAVPDAFGRLVERAERYTLPPAPPETVVVYSNRTTYRYIDRRPNKPAGALPSFDRQSLVSLGVFDLPPAELIEDGARFDVYREAVLRRNPGAAIQFEPPRP